MGDDGQVTIEFPCRQLDLFPSRIDPAMKILPGLAPGRGKSRAEEIFLQIVVGGSAEVAEIPLLEQWLRLHRQIQLSGERLGGHVRPGQVARQDAPNRMPRKAFRQALGLVEPPLAQGRCRQLDDAVAIAPRLSVSNEVDGHRGILAPAARSKGSPRPGSVKGK